MRLILIVALALSSTRMTTSLTLTPCPSSTDILFVLDSSSSIMDNVDRTNNWEAIRRFTSMAIMNLGQWVNNQGSYASSGLRFALVQFAEFAQVTIDFHTHRTYTDMANAVRTVRNLGGSTNLAAGLQAAERLLPTQSSFNTRKTVIVVISDFKANIDRSELFVAQRIKDRQDVDIVTVGIYGQVNEVLLRQIASDNKAVLSENHQTLLNHISPLLMNMCENVFQPATQCARDIVLVMDASISISTWNTLKEFVGLIAANLANSDTSTRLAVVTFSDTATVLSNLASYSKLVTTTILTAAHSQGLTNIADGLRKAQSLLTDRSRQRHTIVFSDGIATRERGIESTVARSLRSDGINIVAYGVGAVTDKETLQSLVRSDQINTNVIMNPNYATDTNMISQINSVVALTACSNDPNPCVQQAADVVLAIDASGSIVDKGAHNWRLMQNFTIELIRQLVSRYPQIRIGALTFSESARKLSDVTSKHEDVIQAIWVSQNLLRLTNQVDALKTAQNLLNAAPQTGSVKRVKYVIVITDGEHNFGTGTVRMIVDQLERSGIRRIVVGVTQNVNPENLEDIASQSSLIFYRESFSTLDLTLITNVVTATSNCPGDSVVSDLPRTCDAVDVIFAMDRSGSIENDQSGNFQRVKDLISELARSMNIRYSMVRFGLVTFGDTAEIVTWLTRFSNIESFVSTIQRIPYQGSLTNIAAAIRESRRALGQGATRSPLIILVTDGEATREERQEYIEASIARSFGIKISAIAVTQKNFENELTQITGSRDRVFRAPNFERVQNVVVSVTQIACEQGGSTAACTGLPEIVFLLDVSGSIQESELGNAKKFVINAISTFQQGNSNSRFGLVTFSTHARMIFGLTSDLNNIRNMVDTINVNLRGDTNMAEGLERAQQVLHSPRSESNRIIILITDGLANVRAGQEITVAMSIKTSGISIVPVGVTEIGPDYTKLGQIASSPNSVVRALNFAVLNTKIQELIQIACRPDVIYDTPLPASNPRLILTPAPRVPSTLLPSWTIRPLPRPAGLPITCPGSHIVFVIDASRRLYRTQADLDRTKNLVITLMRQISNSRPDAKLAVVSYDANYKVEASFTPYRSMNSLVSVISSITLPTGTNSHFSNMAIGMLIARTLISSNVNSQTVQSYIIIFSDGVSNQENGFEFTQARIARIVGTRIMAVGVGNRYSSLLSRITGDSSLVFDTTDGIDSYISQCGSTAPNVYFARQKSYCPEEIIFVVDSAGNGTIDETNWKDLSDFMSSIVDKYSRFYDIRGRFAAVQYSDEAQVAMTFSKDLPYVDYTLSHLKCLNTSEESSPTMAEGLSLANSLFKENKKEKLVILITDEVADAETTNDILDEVKNLTDRGIKLIVAGIAEGPQHDVFFEEIGGISGGTISVNHYGELKNQVDSVINAACRGDVIFRHNEQNDKITLEL